MKRHPWGRVRLWGRSLVCFVGLGLLAGPPPARPAGSGPESLREQKKVEKHMKAQRGQEASQWNGLVENGGSARPHRE